MFSRPLLQRVAALFASGSSLTMAATTFSKSAKSDDSPALIQLTHSSTRAGPTLSSTRAGPTLSNCYILLPNMLTLEECQHFCNEADQIIQGGNYDRDLYGEEDSTLEKNSPPLRRISIEDMDEQAQISSKSLLAERVSVALQKDFPKIAHFFQLEELSTGRRTFEFASDEPTVNRYVKGGAFELHEDGHDLTCLVLLSDDFDGGGTTVWGGTEDEMKKSESMVIHAPVGTAILFNGDLTHAGNEVTRGVRHLYVGSFNVV